MAYNNLALSLNGTGDCYEALECYRKAISIYENMPEKTIETQQFLMTIWDQFMTRGEIIMRQLMLD